MKLKQLLHGKGLAVALAFAMVPASIAVPQSAPLIGAVAGVSEANAQYYGNRQYRGGRHYYRDRHHRDAPRYYKRRGNNTGAAIGGAIAGLAVGAIIAGSASQPRYVERRYVAPQRVYRAPVSSYRPAPWTSEWYQYCSQRYRSFDARSGTFQPYHGARRLCQ